MWKRLTCGSVERVEKKNMRAPLTALFPTGHSSWRLLQIFFMIVDGVAEMFISKWALYDERISIGKLRLIHVPDFTIALRPLNRYHILSQDGHNYDTGDILLLRFSVDDDYSFNVEHTATGDALYGYQRGSFFKERIFLKVSS